MKQLIDAGLKAAMAGGLPRDEKAAATQRWVAVDAARAAAGGKLTQPQMAAVRAAVAAANEKRAARAAQVQLKPTLRERVAALRDRLYAAGISCRWERGELPALLATAARRERAQARRVAARRVLAPLVLAAFGRCGYRAPSERWCDRAGQELQVRLVGQRIPGLRSGAELPVRVAYRQRVLHETQYDIITGLEAT